MGRQVWWLNLIIFELFSNLIGSMNMQSLGQVTWHSGSACKYEVPHGVRFTLSSCLKVSLSYSCTDLLLIPSWYWKSCSQGMNQVLLPCGKGKEENTSLWSHLLYRQLQSNVPVSSLWALLKRKTGVCRIQNVLFIHVLIWGVTEKTNSWDCCHHVPGVRAKWCWGSRSHRNFSWSFLGDGQCSGN